NDGTLTDTNAGHDDYVDPKPGVIVDCDIGDIDALLENRHISVRIPMCIGQNGDELSQQDVTPDRDASGAKTKIAVSVHNRTLADDAGAVGACQPRFWTDLAAKSLAHAIDTNDM